MIDDDGFPCTTGHVLESVFDFIGTPNELDLAFITDENAEIYMRKFKNKADRKTFKSLENTISAEGLHLLT